MTDDPQRVRRCLMGLLQAMRPDWATAELGSCLAVAEQRWSLARVAAESVRIATYPDQTPASIAIAATGGQRNRRPLAPDRVAAHAAAARAHLANTHRRPDA